jgi:GNAT superfamily N-acetyltransferase
MRAEEFVTERKKKKRKNRYFGGYWYPGFGYYGGGYYGSGDGNSGGDGGGGESVTENSNTKIGFKTQKGANKFQTTLMIGDTAAGIYQYDSASGRSIAEIQPEFQSQGLGKLLILHAINTAANLGMDFVEDESRTAAYDNVLDSLESSGYIISDDGYLYITDQ